MCIQGNFVQTGNRNPDRRAKGPLELVRTDLAGPIDLVSIDGHKYALVFTKDFSGAIFVYFLKNKSGTTKATEVFLADTAPYGKIKCIRSDNSTEFTAMSYHALLNKNRIRHETSAPYSPHQNRTAERSWRTLFDMGRCMIIESAFPKELWTYVIRTAAVVRNTVDVSTTGQDRHLISCWLGVSLIYPE